MGSEIVTRHDVGAIDEQALAYGQEPDSSLKVCNDLIEIVDRDLPFVWSSLPSDTREQKVKLWQAQSNNENGVDSILHPASFECQDVIINRVSFANEKGERVNGPKVTMISPDGKLCSVIARIWCEQFIELMRAFGLPPWRDPLRISSKLNKGNGANRFYTLYLQR